MASSLDLPLLFVDGRDSKQICDTVDDVNCFSFFMGDEESSDSESITLNFEGNGVDVFGTASCSSKQGCDQWASGSIFTPLGWKLDGVTLGENEGSFAGLSSIDDIPNTKNSDPRRIFLASLRDIPPNGEEPFHRLTLAASDTPSFFDGLDLELEYAIIHTTNETAVRPERDMIWIPARHGSLKYVKSANWDDTDYPHLGLRHTSTDDSWAQLQFFGGKFGWVGVTSHGVKVDQALNGVFYADPSNVDWSDITPHDCNRVKVKLINRAGTDEPDAGYSLHGIYYVPPPDTTRIGDIQLFNSTEDICSWRNNKLATAGTDINPDSDFKPDSPPSTDTGDPTAQAEGRHSTPAVVGGMVGGFVALLIALAVGVVLYRKRKARRAVMRKKTALAEILEDKWQDDDDTSSMHSDYKVTPFITTRSLSYPFSRVLTESEAMGRPDSMRQAQSDSDATQLLAVDKEIRH